MKTEYLTKNSSQTKALGKKLAQSIIQRKLRTKAIVISLEGELGSGKTAFVQGFAKGLKIKEKILSPTFVILKRFKRAKGSFFHIDCYRVKKPKYLLDLGFKEISSNPKNIIVIEWGDLVKKILPKDALRIKFGFVNRKTRRIVLNFNIR